MGSSIPKPEIISLPSETEVERDASIILTCEANTNKAHAIWKKNKQIIDDGRIKVGEKGPPPVFTLKIDKACNADEGEYTVTLSNKKGYATKSTKIKVLEFDTNWRDVKWGTTENESMKTRLRQFRLSNPKVKHLRFLLHGPVGAGKSSLINSIKSIFEGKIQVSAPVAPHSQVSYTQEYKTYQFKDGEKSLSFVFNDSMGLQKDGGGPLVEDILSALKGHVKEKYKFNPETPLSNGCEDYESSPTLSDQAHCLVSVIPADKIVLYGSQDKVVKKMQDIRNAARDLGIPQVVLMTHVDRCCPLVEKDLKRIYSSKKMKRKICECENLLGLPRNCIFPVKIYHEETTLNDDMDCLILDALSHLVDFADDYIIDK